MCKHTSELKNLIKVVIIDRVGPDLLYSVIIGMHGGSDGDKVFFYYYLGEMVSPCLRGCLFIHRTTKRREFVALRSGSKRTVVWVYWNLYYYLFINLGTSRWRDFVASCDQSAEGKGEQVGCYHYLSPS